MAAAATHEATALSALRIRAEQASDEGAIQSVMDVLGNAACLACVFSWLDSDLELVRCGAVCRIWRSVLDADAVWQEVYLAQLPPPAPEERVGSYRQQFARLRGLLAPGWPAPTALKGVALCYNSASGHLVAYNPRQRMMSVQLPDGSIRSAVLEAGGAGTAHRPLLASSNSEVVVLAAFDGQLQLWDARACTPLGLLGSHPSFVTSLDASGPLVASTCSSELRLWQLNGRQCVFQVPMGLPLPSPVLEPHVAVCAEQQLLALANCAAPAPSSAVKIYSTQPAAINASTSNASTSNASTSGGASAAAAAAAAPPAEQGVRVGSAGCPELGGGGALLLRELPVNAAADMRLARGLLLVASCFHGRSVSSTSPYKNERPYTVVVHLWDTATWQLTRLVSPRLWTDYPIYSMTGTPTICLSQGLLMVATLRSGGAGQLPTCCVHAWQLPAHLARGGSGGRHACTAGADGSSSVCLLSVGGGGNSAATSSGSAAPARRQPEAYGEGATALGRAAVSAAGGVAPGGGLSSSNTVMLAVSEAERASWRLLVEDTKGRLVVLASTPRALVLATEAGQVLSCTLLAPEAGAAEGDADGAAAAAVAGAGSGGGGPQLAVADGGRLMHVTFA